LTVSVQGCWPLAREIETVAESTRLTAQRFRIHPVV
jgi:hypothetical protein